MSKYLIMDKKQICPSHFARAKEIVETWQRSQMEALDHLLGENPDGTSLDVPDLEDLIAEGFQAVENISSKR